MYSILMHFFDFGLWVLGLFKPGIKAWNQKRQNDLISIKALPPDFSSNKKVIWVHCASLGEFEQARHVIDLLKASNKYFIALSFFSPSGYEIRKNYHNADLVFYLPIDKRANAKSLIQKLKPSVFIGVKYEFWWNLFDELNKFGIPKYLIALKLSKDKYFFKPYALRFLQILKSNSFFFCQDINTAKLLLLYGFDEHTIHTVGDPRIDGILSRPLNDSNVSFAKNIIPLSKKTIVYGSIYKECMPHIAKFINANAKEYCHILVPHDVGFENVRSITNSLTNEWTFLKDCQPSVDNGVIIVNEVGKLFDLYAVANMCYIGGGFTKNVHNTLEPARFGLPIAIGPKHKGFYEVDAFLQIGIITEIGNQFSLSDFVDKCTPEMQMACSAHADQYFLLNKDASQKIVNKVIMF